MKKKLDHESVYNLCASVFITILITLFCGIVVTIFRPVKTDKLNSLPQDGRILYCEKNEQFSLQKLAELEAKDLAYDYLKFDDLLKFIEEEKEFCDFCVIANSLTEISLWKYLKKVIKELENAKDNYVAATEKLKEESASHKKTSDKLNAADAKLKEEKEKY